MHGLLIDFGCLLLIGSVLMFIKRDKYYGMHMLVPGTISLLFGVLLELAL